LFYSLETMFDHSCWLSVNHETDTKTKGPAKADPSVLTNPLNSPTKLQIETTLQN
jgi:hypothetical protein